MSDRPNLIGALGLLPEGCRRFTQDASAAFFVAPGSGGAHQDWIGGYADHLDECFGIARELHETLAKVRPLPFTIEDALLVLFLHDVQKIFKRLPSDVSDALDPVLKSYAETDPGALRELIMADYDVEITDEQDNALQYVHGEDGDYRPGSRVTGPLGAFCHAVDFLSARLWFDEPRASGPIR